MEKFIPLRNKIVIGIAALALTLGLTAGIASAQNVHFKHGSPTAVDNGLTLTMSGVLTGLGGGDILVTLSATADATTTCANPSGKEAPGQNPADITTAGSVAIPSGQIKNGNAPFTVVTQDPGTPTPQEAGCPNNQWTASFDDLLFNSALLIVRQCPNNGSCSDASKVEVLRATFTISPPSSDGPIPGIP